jgi:hypothetical protein
MQLNRKFAFTVTGMNTDMVLTAVANMNRPKKRAEPTDGATEVAMCRRVEFSKTLEKLTNFRNIYG